MQKSYFCYESLDSFDALAKPLPKFGEFEDRLSGTNSLNADYERFQILLQDGYNEKQAMKCLGVDEKPEPGHVVYSKLIAEWTAAGYQNLGDVVRSYIVQDTKPLLHGLHIEN